MPIQKFLEGKKVYLSPIKEEDIGVIIELMNDENVRVVARKNRGIINEARMKDRINHILKEAERFLIHKKENDEIIGDITLDDIDKSNRSATFGIAIKDNENRGKGYGTDSIELILKHAFINLNLESVVLGVYEYNRSAIRVYEKIGFKYCGRLRNAKIIGNKKYDDVLMDILSEEYFEKYGNNEMGKYGLE